MKKLLLILILAFNLFAYNWATGDTCFVRDTLDSGTVYYTSLIRDIGDRETYWVVLTVQDTAQAGYANDSVDFIFGYQLGTSTTDSTDSNANSTLDTIWDEDGLYVLDTFTVDSFGVGPHYYTHSILDVVSSDGATSRAIDTSDVAGYATMIARFTPGAGYLIRFWVAGRGDSQEQAKGYALKIRFDFQGTIFNNVRRQ